MLGTSNVEYSCLLLRDLGLFHYIVTSVPVIKICQMKWTLKSDIFLCMIDFVTVFNKPKESMGICSSVILFWVQWMLTYFSICYLCSLNTYLFECLIPSYLDTAQVKKGGVTKQAVFISSLNQETKRTFQLMRKENRVKKSVIL